MQNVYEKHAYTIGFIILFRLQKSVIMKIDDILVFQGFAIKVYQIEIEF